MREIKKSEVEDIIGLTPIQEGMLFHYLQDSKADHYHEQLCLRLTGTMHEEWFREAWNEVTRTNELLRTVFRWENVKQPIQIILKSHQVALDYTDLSREIASVKESALEEAKKRDLQQKFDLQDVPFRVSLFQVGDRAAVMLVSNHHILYDGWSSGIILKEFLEAYDRLSRQQETPARAKTPFKTFVKWLQSQDKGKQAAYWGAYLNELEDSKPLSVVRKARTAGSGGHERMKLSAETKRDLERFAASHELTLASVFFAAWGILLQRYKNSREAVFGTTLSGRPAQITGCEEMVGLFINTVPLRVPFREGWRLLEAVKKTNEDLREREEYEHTSIVDIKSYARRKPTAELFDTVMVVENYPLDQRLKTQHGALAIDSYSAVEQTNYDLLVSLEIDEAIQITASYNSGVYDKTAIRKILQHFSFLLSQLIQQPDMKLEEVEMISDAEKAQILNKFNHTAAEYRKDRTLHAWFEEQAAKTPDRIAVVDDEASITYRALDERANRLAHRLRSKGVETEHIVGLLMPRSIDGVAAILGVLKAGGAYLPIDPGYPAHRIEHMLQDSGARLLIADGELIGAVRTIPWPGETVMLDDPGADSFPSHSPAVDVTVNHLAYVIYTSGSTGKPKGVLIEHRNVVNLIAWYAKAEQIDENAHIAFMTNYVFDPSVEEVFGALLYGATLHCLKPDVLFDRERLFAFLQSRRIRTIFLTPAMLKELFYDCTNTIGLKSIIVGGEKLEDSLKNQIIANGFVLYNSYGPTETTVDTLTIKCELERDVVLGKPIDNVRVYILHKHHEFQPVGVIGELCISGDGVGRGYLNQPELTRKKFIPDPFVTGHVMYRTGDLARWLPDGTVEYIGRLDHQVKINGVRIELEELEANLRKHPQVQDAIVVQKKNKHGESYVAAYYVSARETAAPEALKEFLKEALPDNMIPSVYVPLEKLPLNPSGKVDRTALPEPPEAAVDLAEKTYVKPEKAVEKAIAELWKEALGIERVGLHDNFFDIGGNSLKIVRVFGRMKSISDKELTIADMFTYPTVSALADFLTDKQPAAEPKRMTPKLRKPDKGELKGGEIAVIGMAGRFPGAGTIEEFWTHLQQGTESIRFYSDEELRQLGVDNELVSNPAFVKTSGGVLQDREWFDAAFFGYSPKEAELMDPQMRLLHETVWEALEHAGYNPEDYPGEIGLYAGASDDFFWTKTTSDGLVSPIDQYKASLLSRKDFLCTNISYKLNLRGPSYTLQTGCSTSLVAIANACQALLSGQCDMAVAGGASVYPEMEPGYLFEEGMIFSPDGHCRAFDEQARGTVPGEGVGVVVLKRLQAAREDGDYIHAVVKGVGTNNDGYRKVGFTAPSIEGQASAIQAAHRMAGVEPESIGYIEAHGTATTLGDPVELEALRRAFQTKRTGYCAIGSVKTNIGHLDAAAGVAGFIKTVQALKHRQIPASLHFETPTPKFDFKNSPFYVNRALADWKRGEYPLRAGVSSFGIGGTNAHVVLEEAVHALPSSEQAVPRLLPLSARSPEALDRLAARLSDYARSRPAVPLSAVAHTLQTGRKAFPYRKTLVCSTLDEAEGLFDAQDAARVFAAKAGENPPIVFMFPGQGAQHVHMGYELYQNEPAYRTEVDRCFAILSAMGAGHVQEALYPLPGTEAAERFSTEREAAAERIVQTEYAQPALFVVEYALARLLMSWGAAPSAMIGHSLGEYVAACLAGVISLEDALWLVVARGKRMQEMPTGSMLSVPLSRAELEPLMNEEFSLAAVNAPAQCVVSGDHAAIDRLERQLTAQGLLVKRLQTSHAFHSKSMDPMLADFEAEWRNIKLQPPKIPYISNLTGNWMTIEEATDPKYWVRHLRETVSFSEGVSELLKLEQAVWVEVGPGKTLASLVNRRRKPENGPAAIALSDPTQAARLGRQSLMQALGKLWALGVNVEWSQLDAHERKYRVPLPTYPFERKRYWLKGKRTEGKPEAAASARLPLAKKQSIADWFYMPSWERSIVPRDGKQEAASASTWLIFADEQGIGEALADRLRAAETQTVTVLEGMTAFKKLHDQMYAVNPSRAEDYRALFSDLQAAGRLPDRIVHFWSMSSRPPGALTLEQLEAAQNTGYFSCMSIVQTLGALQITKPIRMTIVTSDMHDVTGEEQLKPEQATVLGFVKICPLEYPNIECQSIDISLRHTNHDWPERLLSDILATAQERMLAYRGAYRWVPTYQAVPLERRESAAGLLKGNGVYLITGGLGGIGFGLAATLAESVRAKFVLLGRSRFPERQSWPEWLSAHEEQDAVSQKIRTILKMEEQGAEVLVISANLTDRGQMEEALAQIAARFGKLDGVVHAAGIPDYEGVIQNRTREQSEKIFAPKVKGTLILDSLLKDQRLDFFVLCSSNGNISYHYKFGQVSYNAANEFLDAYAGYKRAEGRTHTVSINWCDWKDVGMSVAAAEKWGRTLKTDTQTLLKDALNVAEGTEVFRRILDSLLTRVVVSPADLHAEIAHEQASFREMVESREAFSAARPEQAASGHSLAQAHSVQSTLVAIWKDLLGKEDIGIHDNIFDLGANSLDVIQANSRLKTLLKQEIPIVTMYTYPTIHSLKEHLTRSEEPSAPQKDAKLNKDKKVLSKTLAKLKSHS
ncbi:amino acid adenylation domain-containing protein [Paenibacillus elgii]